MIWRYKDVAIELLRRDGMRPLIPAVPAIQKRLESVALECFPWVRPYLLGMPSSPRAVPSLIYVYPYSKEEQQRHQTADGLCSTFTVQGSLRGDVSIAAIGIATDVISGNLNYLRLVFLHELAHLKFIKHKPDYVQHLNHLVYQFNKAMGTKIENDLCYCGRYVDANGHYLHRADGRTRIVA